MALNFDKKAVMNLDEPITDNEIESVLTEYETLTQNIEGIDSKNVESFDEISEKKSFEKQIKFASDFRKKSSLPCLKRTRKRKKKREREKQIKEQQAREQAARNGKARKYAKEMRNRDEITKAAKELQAVAIKTATMEDDIFIKKALTHSHKFDKLIYGTATSDVEDKFQDLFDNIDDTGDID